MQDIITTPTCFLQKIMSGQINSTEPFKISEHPDEPKNF
jgi:hypothetical protein